MELLCRSVLAMSLVYGSRPPSEALVSGESVAEVSFLKAVLYLALSLCGHLYLCK